VPKYQWVVSRSMLIRMIGIIAGAAAAPLEQDTPADGVIGLPLGIGFGCAQAHSHLHPRMCRLPNATLGRRDTPTQP